MQTLVSVKCIKCNFNTAHKGPVDKDIMHQSIFDSHGVPLHPQIFVFQTLHHVQPTDKGHSVVFISSFVYTKICLFTWTLKYASSSSPGSGQNSCTFASTSSRPSQNKLYSCTTRVSSNFLSFKYQTRFS
jgi:hypothetical protein